jgi:hypothetical protein
MGLVEIGLIVGLNNKLAGCLFLLSSGYALFITEKICCCLAGQRGSWEGNVVICLYVCMLDCGKVRFIEQSDDHVLMV